MLNKKFQIRTSKKSQEESKAWYNLGWVIFLSLLFFPFALIYILIKLGDKNAG